MRQPNKEMELGGNHYTNVTLSGHHLSTLSGHLLSNFTGLNTDSGTSLGCDLINHINT